MKRKKATLALVLVFLTGLALLLYPLVNDFWNSLHQSRAIANYTQAVAEIDNDHYRQLWSDAQTYNVALVENDRRYTPTSEETALYESLLDITETGIMGYIEITSIQVSLPIYHGVDEAVLQTAIGHIEGTSLPVGGESTHCVISGHRGLPSAKLFTDLDQLEEGDTFLLRVLDETLTYEVDQIHIVEPYEIDRLEIEEGEDLCTLVTCTPYGVNSHRLLVRGHRVASSTPALSVRVTADALQMNTLLVATAVAAPVLLILLISVLLWPSGRKKRTHSVLSRK